MNSFRFDAPHLEPGLAGTILRSLSIKIAQKLETIGSLGPKALNYESFEGNGITTGDYQEIFYYNYDGVGKGILSDLALNPKP